MRVIPRPDAGPYEYDVSAPKWTYRVTFVRATLYVCECSQLTGHLYKVEACEHIEAVRQFIAGQEAEREASENAGE